MYGNDGLYERLIWHEQILYALFPSLAKVTRGGADAAIFDVAAAAAAGVSKDISMDGVEIRR